MHLYRGDESPEERLATAMRTAEAASRAPGVVALAGACGRAARRRAVAGVYALDLAYLDACMEAVQSLPTIPDAPGVDGLREPEETIRDGGDCEDKSALLAALVLCGRELLARAVAVGLVWVLQPGWPDDHFSAWVSSGDDAPSRVTRVRVIDQTTEPPRGVWWAETTVRAARGESPRAAVRRIGGGHGGISA